MQSTEIVEMIQGWIDDLNGAGLDWAELPDEMREKLEKLLPNELHIYYQGQIDALQSVINQIGNA